jgi:hypothetical protein
MEQKIKKRRPKFLGKVHRRAMYDILKNAPHLTEVPGKMTKVAGAVRKIDCKKKGGVWSKGECIPKSKIRTGRKKHPS